MSLNTKEILHIYVRVSSPGQTFKDYSRPRQRSIGIAKAKELGMDYEIYEEGPASASQEDFNNRPELMKILEGVKEGIIKHLFVFDQTRLSRNDITKDIINHNLRKKKVRLYTHSKDFDFDNPADSLTFKILQAIESYETALRKARFALGYYSGNIKGRFLKGIPPYGYCKDKDGKLVIDNEEREVFLKIVDLYLRESYGTNRIAEYLNSKFIQTKTSKILKNGYTLHEGKHNRRKTLHKKNNEWNPGTINTMLQNEIYIGKRKFKVDIDKYEYVEVEPILSVETFDLIQEVRKNNAIVKKRKDVYFYLLKDLCTCGNCGSPMHGRTKLNRKEYTYKCNSKRNKQSPCTSRGVNIFKLESLVWKTYQNSYNFTNIVNLTMLEYEYNSSKLDESLEENLKKLKNLSNKEKLLKDKRKRLLDIMVDPEFKEFKTKDYLAGLNREGLDIENDRKLYLSNIEILKDKLKRRRGKPEEAYEYAMTIHSLANPPFLSTEVQEKAKSAINAAIKNIVVTYYPSERHYKIDIEFQPSIGTLSKMGDAFDSENPNSLILKA